MEGKLAIDWIVSSPSSCAEALTSNVTIFGGGAFMEVIKVKWGYKVRPWSGRTGVLIRMRGDTRELALSPHCVRAQWEGDHLQARKGALTGNWTLPDVGLGLSSLQSCETIHFCCLGQPVFGIFLWWSKQSKTGIMMIIRIIKTIIDWFIYVSFWFPYSKVWVKSHIYFHFTGGESDD